MSEGLKLYGATPLDAHCQDLLRLYYRSLRLRLPPGAEDVAFGRLFYKDLQALGIDGVSGLLDVVRAILGVDSVQERLVSYGIFELNTVDRTVHRTDIQLEAHLTGGEARMFYIAVINGGRIVSHSRFRDAINSPPGSNVAKSFVSRIRDKIQDPRQPDGNYRFWQTVRGIGYRLVA